MNGTPAKIVVEAVVPDEDARSLIDELLHRSRTDAIRDRNVLDRVILLHQPSEPDEWDGSVCCEGCFGEWPCSTQQVFAEWGQP